MRLRQLENFIVICEAGSISRASEMLHVAQPALGLQIKSLEEEVGICLISRSSRGITPTAAGFDYLRWAKATVASYGEMKKTLIESHSVNDLVLRLGVSPSLSIAFAVPIVRRLHLFDPRIRVQVVEATGSALKDMVNASQVDLCLSSGYDGNTQDCIEIASEELFLIRKNVSSHVPHAIDTCPFSALEHYSLALPTPPNSIRSIIEGHAAAHSVDLKIDYEIQSVGAVLNLVKAGLAASVAPLSVLLTEVQLGAITLARIQDVSLHRQLIAVQAPNPLLSHGKLRDITVEIRQAIENEISQGKLADGYQLRRDNEENR